MSKGICRVQKIAAPKDIAGIQIHNRRERNRSNTNPDINRARSAENYTIVVHPDGNGFRVRSNRDGRLPNTSRSYNSLIDERIKAGYTGKKAVRKDAVRCCEVLFTASGDFFDRHPDQEEPFFIACAAFAAERFGAANIIAATVHMDEDTPHMHLDFVPLTADGRLSAKSMLGGRREMQQLQDDFYERVGRKFGLERGTRADLDDPEAERPRKHLTVRELKAETAARISEQQQIIREQQARLDQMQEKEQQLESSEQRHQEYLDRLRTEEGASVRRERLAREEKERLEREAARLEQTAEEKRQEYDETLRKLRPAAELLSKLLTAIAEASKRHKISHLFGSTVTCDKESYEAVVSYCQSIKDEVWKAVAYREEIGDREQAIQKTEEELRKQLEDLSRQRAQVSAVQRDAESKQARYAELVQKQQQLIEQRSAELADSRVKAMFRSVPDSRRERLEAFCRSLRLESGKNVLETFEEEEQKLLLQYQSRGRRRR